MKKYKDACIKKIKMDKWYLLALAVMWAVIGAFVCNIYSTKTYGLGIPLRYNHNDVENILQVMIRAAREGSLYTNPLTAAPFTADYHSMLSLCEGPLHYLMVKCIYFFCGDVFIVYNVILILMPFINATVSFICCKQMNLTPFSSAATSATFALSTFYFARFMHIMYIPYYSIPLITLIGYWIYTETDYLMINKNFFRKSKNIITIFLCAVISATGNIYYQFFACFFILIAGAAYCIREKKLAVILKSLSIVFGIVFFLLLYMSPALIYMLQNGATSNQTRAFNNSEVYALQIIQMMIPYYSHRIGIIDKIMAKYNSQGLLINENRTSYLGLIGICGFIFLLIYLFNKKDDKNDKRLEYLSTLNIWAILLGTFGGGGALFAFFISTKIRGYNRISIFILFFCAAAIGVIIDYAFKKLKNDSFKPVFAVLTAGVCLLGIWEQTPAMESNSAYVLSSYNTVTNDKEFYIQIDNILPDGAMVYQMPYLKYPEGRSEYAYVQFVGTYYSDNLRWSFGSLENTKEDAWHRDLSEQPLESQLQDICLIGFDGLCIYKALYDNEAEFNNINDQLKSIIGQEPVYDGNNTISFYDLSAYAEKIRSEYSDSELDDYKDFRLNCLTTWEGEFSHIESSSSGENNWRWCGHQGDLIIENRSENTYEAVLDFGANIHYNDSYTITISDDNGVINEYAVTNQITDIQLNIILNPGENIIHFSTDAPALNSDDPRTICFGIWNFQVKNIVSI